MNFIPNKECFCGSTDGRCRTTDSGTYFCMGADQHSAPPGFRFIGYTKDKVWGQFVVSKGNGFDKGEWKRQKAAIRQQREQEEAKRKASAMPAKRRDRYYRQLLEQLSLHPADKADLLRRGLTEEQIKAGGFKSVEKWQKLEFPLPITLPGVNIDGQSLTVGAAGYLIPILDNDGLIVGLQMRLRDSGEGGRYRWVSSKTKKRPDGPTAHMPNGENPIAVARPLDGVIQQKAIGMAEGILKPFIAAQKRKQVVLGAAGGQFASSPETLKASLEKLSAELGTDRIEFFPDAGSASNPNVVRQYVAAWELLESWGYVVQVAWWNQTTKGQHPDIDELEDLGAIAFITPAQFLEKAIALGYKPEEESDGDSDQARAKAKAAWKKGKQFTPTHQICQKYFDWESPAANTAIFGRSGLGSGKSTYVGKIITISPDEGYISYGPISNLMTQFTSKINRRLKDSRLKPKFYHLRDDDAANLIPDPQSKLAACIDSILRFTPKDFDGKTLILDELSSVIRALLTRNTAINRDRDRAKFLFQQALRRASRIICLDGNLKDWEVDYVLSLADRPDLQVLKILNSYQGEKAKVLFYKADDQSALRKRLLIDYANYKAGRAKPLVFLSDSQKECQDIDQCLGGGGLRLDSRTMAEPWVSEFLDDPDDFIERNKPAYLILSPSCESGLDISIKGYFGNVYASFFGVIGTDQQLQMLGRIRDQEGNRFVWSKDKSIASGNCVSKEYFPSEVSKAIEQYLIADGLALIEGRSNSQQQVEELIRFLLELQEDSHYKAFSQMAALDNFEGDNLQDCLIESLEQSGYTVEVTDECLDPDKWTTGKEQIQRQDSDQIFNAPDITPKEAEELVKKNTRLGWEKQCAVTKSRLKERLPGIENSEAWSSDFVFLTQFQERGFIRNIENLWLLQNPEVARLFSMKKWNRWTEKQEIDLAQAKSKHLRIKTLRDLGFMDFLDPKEVWSQDHPKIQRFYKACKKPEVALKLGLEVGDSKPCQWLRRVLEEFGLTTRSNQKRVKKKRVWFYQVITLEAIPEEIERQQQELGEAIENCNGSYDSKQEIKRLEKSIALLKFTPDIWEAVDRKYRSIGLKQPEIEEKFSRNFGISLNAETIDNKELQPLESVTPSPIYINHRDCDTCDIDSVGSEPTPSPSPNTEQAALPPSSETVWQESRSRLVEGMRVKYLNLEWKVMALGTVFASLQTATGYRCDSALIHELIPLETAA